MPEPSFWVRVLWQSDNAAEPKFIARPNGTPRNYAELAQWEADRG